MLSDAVSSADQGYVSAVLRLTGTAEVKVCEEGEDAGVRRSTADRCSFHLLFSCCNIFGPKIANTHFLSLFVGVVGDAPYRRSRGPRVLEYVDGKKSPAFISFVDRDQTLSLFRLVSS